MPVPCIYCPSYTRMHLVHHIEKPSESYSKFVDDIVEYAKTDEFKEEDAKRKKQTEEMYAKHRKLGKKKKRFNLFRK